MTRRRALVIGAIVLLLVGVAAFALTRPDTVAVPNVTGKTRTEAQRILQAKGFDVNSEARPFCAEPGLVVEQSPGDGEEADEGSTVTITVSTGQSVPVPKVAGLPLARARAKINDAQLELKGLREKFSSQAKPGQAVGSIPPRGTSVDCGSPVTLLVSKGTNVVELPNVIGQQEVDAKAELDRLGFIVDVDERDADQPEGEVIGQNPGPGSRLKKGSTVAIIVSTGAGSVVMPNVIGQSRQAATANLSSRGLSVTVVERSTNDESDDDRVLDQAPDAGERLLAGDEVTIYVGVFKEPPTDDDLDLDDAEVAPLPGWCCREGGRPQRRALERARGLARVRRLGGRGPDRGRARAGGGADRARRPLDARRRRGRPAAGRGPARSRRRLPGAARALRRGRQRPGPARMPRRPLRRPGRAGGGRGHGQADLQAAVRLPRPAAGGVLRGRRGGLARAGGGDGAAAVGEAVTAGLERRHLQGLRAPRPSSTRRSSWRDATTRG